MNDFHYFKWFALTLSMVVNVQSAIVDDCENGTINNLIGGTWSAFSDEVDSGSSTITNLTPEEDHTGFYVALPTANEGYTGAGLVIQYKFGTIQPHRDGMSWGAQIGTNTSLSSEQDGVCDLTDATSISFRAKSSVSGLAVRFMVPTSDVEDFVFHRVPIVVDTIWAQYTINIDSLKRPIYADPIAFNRAHAMRLQWDISAEDNKNTTSGTFYLDDIAIEGYSYTPTVIIENEPSISTDRRPSFCWHTVETASNYSIQVYNTPLYTEPVWDSSTIKTMVSDTCYTPSVDLVPGYVFWRVKSDISEWSSTGRYIIMDDRVPIPVPVESPTINRRPLLTWNAPESATSYKLEVSTIPVFTDPLISVPVADTFFQITTDLPLESIYWRVKSDLVEIWSDVSYFWILPDSIPFIARYNGAMTENRRPVFTWNKVPNATTYRFMLADNHSYTDAISLPLADTIYIPTVDLVQGKWYWKVSCDRNPSLFSPDDSLIIVSTGVAVPTALYTMNEVKLIRYRSGITVISKRPLPSGSVGIYDLSGRLIATPNVIMNTEYSSVTWSFTDKKGRCVPAGIYLIRIREKSYYVQYAG